MLTFRQAEKGADDQMLDELEKAFMAAGHPKEAAVFGRIDSAKKCCRYCFNPETCQFCSDAVLRWDGIECGDSGPGMVRLIGWR